MKIYENEEVKEGLMSLPCPITEPVALSLSTLPKLNWTTTFCENPRETLSVLFCLLFFLFTYKSKNS